MLVVISALCMISALKGFTYKIQNRPAEFSSAGSDASETVIWRNICQKQNIMNLAGLQESYLQLHVL